MFFILLSVTLACSNCWVMGKVTFFSSGVVEGGERHRSTMKLQPSPSLAHTVSLTRSEHTHTYAAVPSEKAPRGEPDGGQRSSTSHHITGEGPRPQFHWCHGPPCLSLIRNSAGSTLSTRRANGQQSPDSHRCFFSSGPYWVVGSIDSVDTGIFPVQSIHLALSADATKEARDRAKGT